tara:strand:- start:359 stop:499 length:141 start_codon:yes stop_codon:yes gene_type:complete
MKVKITYYLNGKTWDEVIHADNVSHAREIAAIRNPKIKIIASNPFV